MTAFLAAEQETRSTWRLHEFESEQHFLAWLRENRQVHMCPPAAARGRKMRPDMIHFAFELKEDHPMTARTANPTAETVTANLDLFRQFSALFRQKYPAIAGACNGRLERAERIAATPGAITPASDWPDTYYVKSESNPRTSYRVNVKERSCTCPDHGKSEKAQADGRPAWICKHRLAVGLAVRGPEWQRERLAAELHTARAAMRAAWQAVIDLTDAFENLDPGAPEIDQAHAAMLAAAERAEQLDAHYRQAWQSFEARRHVVTA